MKASLAQYYRFRMLPLALVLLCTFFLLPASAVAATVRSTLFFQQQDPPSNNGRSAADRARRGAPVRQARDTSTRDVLRNGTDFDEGYVPTRFTASSTPVDASLQVEQGAPGASIFVAADGDIGLGTKVPRGRLHVMAGPDNGSRDLFLLDGNGNLEIGGVLTEASSVLLKEHFAPVDARQVLARLATLPVTTWNYKTDEVSVRHMGPMAQDFYAAFGLGKDEQHLAPLDANGVALVALQALYRQTQAQAAHIATLEKQNEQLLRRLEALEVLVNRRPER